MGYGEAKQLCFEALNAELKEPREKLSKTLEKTFLNWTGYLNLVETRHVLLQGKSPKECVQKLVFDKLVSGLNQK